MKCNNHVQNIGHDVFVKYQWSNGQMGIFATHFYTF